MQVIKNNIILSQASVTLADFAYPVDGVCLCFLRKTFILFVYERT
jgi:hypothetical protein